ncbi:uncharacterized protein LOC126617895 [Malus sylvestris]|uniref:uncharacterized protein LOC126617895 n=1 Tax=Malus sylvestris TaxID=3752 RepID=UPI0021ACF5CB|nr:uncharacterized protein LOC126617895 [Malus sylvestris]
MGSKRKLRASTSCQAEGTSSESGITRFSDLPEEVAHHILSFLNFKDYTRVGALSKRCRQIHLSAPEMDFGAISEVIIMNEKTIKALYQEGSKPTRIWDKIQNLSIHCESLNNKLVPAVVSLLRRMPNLNILCIKTSCEKLAPEKASHFGNEYWKLQNLAFIYQLKEVSIENSYGSNEIEFARYILDHARNLRKMVIAYRDQNAPSKIAGMVSRCNRISTPVVIIRRI